MREAAGEPECSALRRAERGALVKSGVCEDGVSAEGDSEDAVGSCGHYRRRRIREVGRRMGRKAYLYHQMARGRREAGDDVWTCESRGARCARARERESPPRRPAQTALGLAQTEAAYQRARRRAAGLDGRARPASGRGAAAQAMPQVK